MRRVWWCPDRGLEAVNEVECRIVGQISEEKEANMRTLSGVVILGIGFLLCSGSPARAQLGDMGEAVKKGAGEAVKQEVMKGAAEKAGLPAPGAPAATPGAATGAESAPAGEPGAAPAAAEAPPAAPGTDTGAPDAPSGD